MANTRQLPGVGNLTEATTSTRMVPGIGMVTETVAAVAAGRIMSSLAASGGLAGYGGIAGQGGGLAG